MTQRREDLAHSPLLFSKQPTPAQAAFIYYLVAPHIDEIIKNCQTKEQAASLLYSIDTNPLEIPKRLSFLTDKHKDDVGKHLLFLHKVYELDPTSIKPLTDLDPIPHKNTIRQRSLEIIDAKLKLNFGSSNDDSRNRITYNNLR